MAVATGTTYSLRTDWSVDDSTNTMTINFNGADSDVSEAKLLALDSAFNDVYTGATLTDAYTTVKTVERVYPNV